MELPEEWIAIAEDTRLATVDLPHEAMRAALSAILPLILERAAGCVEALAKEQEAFVEAFRERNGPDSPSFDETWSAAKMEALNEAHAAIRALGEEKP